MKVRNHRLQLDDGRAAAYAPSPNCGGPITPRYLILHYTAGSSAASTVAWFLDRASRVSAHLVIARDGTPTQLVPFDREAWHAGRSRWGSLSALNRYSIGIELDNAGCLVRSGGRWVSPLTRRSYPDREVTVATHRHALAGSSPCGWHAYTPEQIESTLACGLALVAQYGLVDVLGHEDVAPGRKTDPGPDFPMASVRARLQGRGDDRPERCVTTARLFIRTGPGTDHAPLPGTPVPPGTEVEVVARAGVWWQVDLVAEADGVMDLVGWCHSKYLERVSASGDPFVEQGTPP